MDCTKLFRNAVAASHDLSGVDDSTVSDVLLAIADEAESGSSEILQENEKDLALMEKSDQRYDRLQITPDRMRNITADIRKVAVLPAPHGRTVSEYRKENGLIIRRVTVPFGVVGVIYESRPNVTFDVFSLCLKSGNAAVLKGGSDAVNSNASICRMIRKVLKKYSLNEDMITLLPPGRDETIQLLRAREYIDLLIPRGSRQLIGYVRENASVPVIETGAGICHTYFDEYGNLAKGREIVKNAKTRRVSVCNALDCLIVHENRIEDLFDLIEPCIPSKVVVYADDKAYKSLDGKYPPDLLLKATDGSFGTEFLSYKMAVKSVSTFAEALEHISRYGSRHSEAIISDNNERLIDFCRKVDASAVYTNSSTAFTDGAEFGLGAEIGISTQKLHARGPMALEALTTYKWIIKGDGQVRP